MIQDAATLETAADTRVVRPRISLYSVRVPRPLAAQPGRRTHNNLIHCMIDQPAPLSHATLEQRREFAIARLSEHFAQDHLSVEELESRFERAYRATSGSQLDALMADLPALADRGQPMTAVRAEPVQIPRHQSVVAIMAGTSRRGTWTAPEELTVFTLMGGVDLDLREAHLPPRGTTITVYAMWGGVDIVVPEGVRVECTGTAFMGAFSDHSKAGSPSGPLVRVGGFVFMGGAEVRTRPQKREIAAERRLRAAERRALGGSAERE